MSDVLSVKGADVYVGESRKQGFTVTDDGTATTPTSATYKRYKDGTALDANPIAASIDGNEVYADVVAGTATGFCAAVFSYTVGTQTVKTRVLYEVKDPTV